MSEAQEHAAMRDTLRREAAAIEALRERMAEIQMNAFKWMMAHDHLKAGKPYSLPKPADLPDKIEVLRAALTTARDYVFDAACGGGWRPALSLALIGQAKHDLALIDAALSASNEGGE